MAREKMYKEQEKSGGNPMVSPYSWSWGLEMRKGEEDALYKNKY